MAIFQKKENTDVATMPAVRTVGTDFLATDIVLQPRLSEKATAIAKQRKFIFLVKKQANKLEIKKALQAMYGISVQAINVINVSGKVKNFGRIKGKRSDFKKAVVTITENSKVPNIAES